MNNLIKKLVVVSRPAGQSLVTRFNRTAPNLLTASASTNESGRFRDSQAETRTSKHDAMLKRDLANLLKNSRQFESNLNGISHTQKVIRNELQKQQMKISVFELKQLLYMSKTDEDLDLLAQAMNRYLVEYHQPYSSKDSQDLTRTFIELLYMLKKTSKAIELFTNPEMRRLFANHRTTEVLYKLVAEADRFNDFVTVLRKMLPRYYKKVFANTDADNQAQQSSQSSSSSPETSGDGGVVRQKRSGDPLVVPVSHMDIISKYLLKHNSVESLAVLKDLIWRIEKSGEEVQPFFKLRCIVLALQKNEALIAKELMKNKFLDKDITMQANLKAMIFSKIGREDDCLRVLKNIFLYGNKIFPFTLKMLREDIEAREGASEFKNEIDFYYKRAHLDERIIEGEDLLELLNAPPMLNTEIFVAVANEDDELLANFAALTAHNDDESAQVPLNILDRNNNNNNNNNNKAAAAKIKNNFSSSA